MPILTIDIDDKITKGFVNFRKANVIGIRNTLNIQANLTSRNAINIIRSDFILRNNFTAGTGTGRGQIPFEKTNSSIISTMEARAGATKRASYMKLQEFGGRRPDPDGRTAIGQSPSRVGMSRRKPISRRLYVKNIKKKIVRGDFRKNLTSSKAKAVASMAVAKKKKLFIKRNNNIYAVRSFDKSSGNVKARLTHMYNIQTGPVHVPESSWLLPATKKPERDGFNIYKSQMKKLWRDGKII